jgi:Protein of unknown function (DUF2778)
MWTYSQSTGAMVDPRGQAAGRGYSGLGDAKNQPGEERVKDHGPIPRGLWRIGATHTVIGLGALVMALTPEAGTETFGRSGFLIHADSIQHPGCASHGCIVLPNALRAAIGASPDRQLQVEA